MSTETLSPPIQEIAVVNTNTDSIGYQQHITARFFHTAGLARVSDLLLKQTGTGRATLEVESYESKQVSKVTVILDQRYVYSLKRMAFAAYLALYDLGEEGKQTARDVMYNLRGETKKEIHLIDKLDE